MLKLTEILALSEADFVALDLAPYADMPAWAVLVQQVEDAYPGWAAFMLAVPSEAGTHPTDSAPAPPPRVSVLMMRLVNIHNARLDSQQIAADRIQVLKRRKYKQSFPGN